MPCIQTPPIVFATTTTTGLNYPHGNVSGLGLTMYVVTTGLTGTWTFLLQHMCADGVTTLAIATVTAGITTNTTTNIALASPFTTATSTPLPNQVVATESVAGDATASFIISWQGN